MGLTNAGVKTNLAYGLSLAAGALVGYIEMSPIGNTATAMARTAKIMGRKALVGVNATLAKKAAEFVTRKLHLSGVFMKSAMRIGGEYLLGAAGEAIEEGADEIVDIATLELAKYLQGEGVVIEDRDYFKRIGESMRMGYLSSLVFGIADLPLSVHSTVSDMKTAKVLSETTPSFEYFSKETDGLSLFKNMTDEQKRDAQKRIFEEGQGKAARDEARIEAEMKARGSQLAGLEERTVNATGEDVTGKEKRLPNNKL
jgi:hypothetical protein